MYQLWGVLMHKLEDMMTSFDLICYLSSNKLSQH